MNKSEIFTAYLTLFFKDSRRFLTLWRQTIIPSAITTSMYFLIFGTFLGDKITFVYDHYGQFIAPGLITMVIVNNSFSNASSHLFQLKMMRAIEEILVSPVPNYVIILAFTSGAILRGLINGIVVFFIATFFTGVGIFNLGIVLLFAILTSIIFALIGILNSIYAKTFDHISIIPNFVLTPMIYLGGTFYALSNLPIMWQKISLINPLFYIIDGMRFGFLGIGEINYIISAIILFFVILILFFVNLFLLKKGIGFKS